MNVFLPDFISFSKYPLFFFFVSLIEPHVVKLYELSLEVSVLCERRVLVKVSIWHFISPFVVGTPFPSRSYFYFLRGAVSPFHLLSDMKIIDTSFVVDEVQLCSPPLSYQLKVDVSVLSVKALRERDDIPLVVIGDGIQQFGIVSGVVESIRASVIHAPFTNIVAVPPELISRDFFGDDAVIVDAQPMFAMVDGIREGRRNPFAIASYVVFIYFFGHGTVNSDLWHIFYVTVMYGLILNISDCRHDGSL